ncbi:MAG: nitroreductase family protein [Phycisphaerales bacterium]|nr:nitroreductase family protein [Phycisphaerae bacterium]NNF44205.1 nitroreductase family protein [Phycisphaerales bacterium]NNM27141.1 nitroreductase family protein [Phycisphaerales bacterium]
MTVTPGFVPYAPYDPGVSPRVAADAFLSVMRRRRSVRAFSDRPVPLEVIESLIASAGTAPSGANKQPWRFVAVQSPALKREIRIAAEEEERAFYASRASAAWLDDLRPLGTDEHKPFLETAPWLIVVFKMVKDFHPESPSDQVYYLNESVGIATGILIAAIHHAGLVTLTHTPSPMKFLGEILGRPAYERPFLLLPVGYPADDCRVPDIVRKPLGEIMVVDRGDDDG